MPKQIAVTPGYGSLPPIARRSRLHHHNCLTAHGFCCSRDPALNSFAKSITEEVIGGLIGFQNVLVFGVDSRSRYDTETALRAAAPGVHIGYVWRNHMV